LPISRGRERGELAVDAREGWRCELVINVHMRERGELADYARER